jgi:A/G-specific adenine glycosylase
LKLWEGLGYYARARRLHAAAKAIADQGGGRVPDTLEGLLALPGVGPYTAAAVASQAFNIAAPALDANAERVLARLLDLDAPVKRAAGRKALEAAVRRITPEGAARELNQALMELGALVCRSFNSECGSCPVRDHCKSLKAHTVDMRPIPLKKPATIRINMVTGVLLRRGRVYVQKRREDDVWPGLWEFPGGVIEAGETEEQALSREFFEEVELRVRPVEKITKIQYSYTRYRVTLNAWRVEELDPGREPVLHEATQLRFVSPSELAALAFPSGHRRLVDTLDRTAPAWWCGA